nr:IS3 family transposase [Halanaerobium congolense]
MQNFLIKGSIFSQQFFIQSFNYDVVVSDLTYVNWHNNHRIHGSLDYLTPIEYRYLMFDKKLF